MSAAVEQPDRIVSIDDAVELIWEEVAAERAADPAEAARALWPHLLLKPDDRDYLAILGLIDLAKREQRHTRRGELQPAIGYGAPHGKKWNNYLALTWTYESANGQQMPLLKFTADDLAAFALRAGKLEASWRDRKKWAISTAEVLKEHSVERVCDLPAGVLADVNAAALEAMSSE